VVFKEYLKTKLVDNLTLAVAEQKGRDLLFVGCQNVCKVYNTHPLSSFPYLDIQKVELTDEGIDLASKNQNNQVILVAGIAPSTNPDVVHHICENSLSNGFTTAIAEQVMSGLDPFSAGQLLEFVLSGIKIVFNEYDFLADNAVLRIALEAQLRSDVKTTLIGAPSVRLQNLINEIKYDWEDDERPVYIPDLCFQLACALTQIKSLPSYLDSYGKIANELSLKRYFLRNYEDTRKAVGSLSHIWHLDKPNLFKLPSEARRRGFPSPLKAQELFDFLQGLSIEPRQFTSASGVIFDVLYVFH